MVPNENEIRFLFVSSGYLFCRLAPAKDVSELLTGLSVVDYELIRPIIILLQHFLVVTLILLYLKSPKHALSLYFMLLPVWSFGSITSNFYAGIDLGYVNIFPRTIVFCSFFLFGFFDSLSKPAKRLPVLLILLSIFGLLGTINSGFKPVSSLLFFHGLLEALMIVYLLRFNLESKDDVRLVFSGLVIGLVAGVIFGLLALTIKMLTGNILNALVAFNSPVAQIYGGIPFLAPQIALLFPLIAFSRGNGLLPSFIVNHKKIVLIILFVSLLVMLKRGSLLILTLLLVSYIYQKPIRNTLKFTFLGLFFVIISSTYFGELSENVFDHFSLLFDSKNNVRLQLYRNVTKVIDNRYLLGIGMGQYRDPDLTQPSGEPMDSPHNLVFHVAAENGIIFLLIFLSIIFITYYNYFYFNKKIKFLPERREFMGIAAGILLYFIYSVLSEGEIAHAYHYEIDGNEIVGIKNSGMIVLFFYYGVFPVLKSSFLYRLRELKPTKNIPSWNPKRGSRSK